MLIDYFFFVQFPAEENQCFSREPRKWVKFLEYNQHPEGLKMKIEAYGLSEVPISLNLKLPIELNQNRQAALLAAIDNLKEVFTGAEMVNIFQPIPGVTWKLKNMPADVILFEERRRDVA